MKFNFDDYIENYRITGDQLIGNCPFHDDRSPSFSANIKLGLWRCFGCNESGDFLQFEHLYESKYTSANTLNNSARLSERTLFNFKEADRIAEYIYCSPDKTPELKITRWESKAQGKLFLQAHYEDGKWKNGGTKNEIAPYLYEHWEDSNLDTPIVFVEGEKCADFLFNHGFLTTTTPGGAGNWKHSFARYFRDKTVLILPDNDAAGVSYATNVLASLSLFTKKVKIINLNHLSRGDDVVDWYKQFSSQLSASEELDKLIRGVF